MSNMNIDENMIPTSPLPSDASDENGEDPVRVDLTHPTIHSKLRNSLVPQTVEKLVFIKSNIAAFYDTPVPDPNDIECSSSDSKDGGNRDQEE